MRVAIRTDGAPAPKGVYSQAIRAHGTFVFVAGQGPADPVTGEMRSTEFRAQAEQTFRNVGALLAAAGTDWAHAVKVNVYLADLNNFSAMNEVYRTFVTEPFPARTTVEAGLGAIAIEVDAIAVLSRVTPPRDLRRRRGRGRRLRPEP